MLKYTKISAVTKEGKTAADYYDEYLKDQIESGGEDAPVLVGKACEALGLKGDLTSEDIHKLFKGINPKTNKPYMKTHNEKHVAGWDATFDPPKDVSALWAACKDVEMRKAIMEAFDASVDVAISHSEDMAAFTRKGYNGTEKEKIDGFAVLKFNHSSSRLLDPQIHCHAVVLNLAACKDGKVRGIHNDMMYHWQKSTREFFHAELAARLQAAGLTLEPEEEKLFSIKGVSEELKSEWSKRTVQVDEKKEELLALGMSMAEANQKAAEETRTYKKRVDKSDNMERWEKEAEAFGFDLDDVKNQTQTTFVERVTDKGFLTLATETKLVFGEKELWALVAREAVCHEDTAHIKERVQKLLKSPELIAAGTCDKGIVRYTTRERVKIELELARMGKEAQGDHGFQISHEVIEAEIADFNLKASFNLNQEQVDMVKHLMGEQKVTMGIGAAGAGKTTAMEVANNIWVKQGYEVIGLAAAASAAEVLEEDSGIKSGTIHSFLIKQQRSAVLDTQEQALKAEIAAEEEKFLEEGKSKAYVKATRTRSESRLKGLQKKRDKELGKDFKPLNKKTVLVMDESSLVDSKLMYLVLKDAERTGAKVVMIGDPMQLNPIGAGEPFKNLIEAHGASIMEETMRQKDPKDKEMVKFIRAGKIKEALDSCAERNLLHIGETRAESAYQLIEDWHKNYLLTGSGSIYASTNQELDLLHAMARKKLQADGSIGKHDYPIETADGIINMSVGEPILFTENAKKKYGIVNGNTGILRKVNFDNDGIPSSLVFRVKEELLEIPLCDYFHFKNSLARTTYKSQGVTNERVFVYANGVMNSKENTYVQMTRAKDYTKVYSDKFSLGEDYMETLVKKMSRSQEKETVLDKVDLSKVDLSKVKINQDLDFGQ